MKTCLDFVWEEYATSTTPGHRLMSLPNLMRLCTDGDFGISTSVQIDVFLETIRKSKALYSLVEFKYLLPLLIGIMRYIYPNVASQIDLTDTLFRSYLFPLAQRLRIQDRRVYDKHPPLPPSPISRNQTSRTM
jgi:hypothetical protein